ncbi:MAG: ABC transporter permease [Eggerthellaceae bacterium]|nr:ABC transporter permease [Eggerthellaceae bacterium]
MLLKLAVRNVRRSARDYAIYFVTIVAGVAVFYAFNSIESQQVLFDIEATASAEMFRMTSNFMTMFSVLIAFVLGFLVVYANRFLIRRRKREFGTYLLLGMSSASTSAIVLAETALVGLASLAVGLAFGIAFSQLLSFATAQLFGLIMSEYHFVFSERALVSTLACFGIIYAIAALLNLVSVNRFKLIDLLSADIRNEKALVRNPALYLAGLSAAIGLLVYAYLQLGESELIMLDDPRFLRATLCMMAGSLMLFGSLAGFAVNALARADGAYLKGLRPFTANQIASKVNTAFLSMWAVCMMLFFSITVFSVGMGVCDILTDDVEGAAPYDATLRSDVYYENALDVEKPSSEAIDERRNAFAESQPAVFTLAESWDYDILAKLEADVAGWNETVKSAAQLDYYEIPGVTYGPLLASVESRTGMQGADESLAESNLVVLSLSQFNATRALIGQAPIELGEGECAVNNTVSMSEGIALEIAQSRQSVDILGRRLIMQERALETQTQTSAIAAAGLEIIVPDSVVEELKSLGAIPLYSYVNAMYHKPGEASDAMLREGIARMYEADAQAGLYDAEWVEQIDAALDAEQFPISIWPVTQMIERSQMLAQAGGLRMLITYLAIYIGLVLLVATAAILAIQQLSETADSLPRYRTLAHLGCDTRMIDRSVLAQTLMYFLLPLAVAVCHAGYVIYLLTSNLFEPMGISAAGPVLMAAALVVAVYGGYLLVTFLASRSMIQSHLRRGARYA